MKPLFVSNKNGQCVVHWKKLTAFLVVVMVLTAGLVEGLWLLLRERVAPPAPSDSPADYQPEFDYLLLFLGQAEEIGGIPDFPTGRLQGCALLGVHDYPSSLLGRLPELRFSLLFSTARLFRTGEKWSPDPAVLCDRSPRPLETTVRTSSTVLSPLTTPSALVLPGFSLGPSRWNSVPATAGCSESGAGKIERCKSES